MDWQEIYAAVRLGLQRTWAVSKPLSIAMGVSSLLGALTPAGLALMSGAVVSDVEALLDSGAEASLAPVLPWLLFGALLIMMSGLAQVVKTYAQDRLGDELGLVVSREVLDQASTLDLSFFERTEKQDVLSRATGYPGRSYLQFVSSVYTSASAAIEFVTLLGVMLWIHAVVTLALASVTIPFLLFRLRMAKLRFEIHRSRTTKRRQAGYHSSLLTNRAAVPFTKVFGLAPLLTERFATTMRELIDVDRDVYRKLAFGRGLMTVGYAIVFVVAAATVTAGALAGTLAIGALVTYLAAGLRFRGTALALVNSITNFTSRVFFVRDLHEFMEERPEIVDREALTPPELTGDVELRGVSFHYPGTDQPVLQDLDLTIPAGQTVAIVGANGAGKTTLVKLIARLYDVDAGAVLLDGHDVRSLALRWLHDRIAYVGQGPVQFEATLEENLAFGDWRNLLGKSDEVYELSQRAGLDELVKELPDGMQTLLGRRFGQYDLSGGQWQRVAVARALARQAPLMILDEPTSNLDARSEYEMFRRFHELTRGRTTILVSHRFSTVRMADRIFVMDEGRIVEEGTHQELAAKGGVYAGLYEAHRMRFDADEDV